MFKSPILTASPFDAIVIAVGHECFKKISTDNWKKLKKKDAIIFDLKGIVPRELNPNRV